LHEKLFIDVWKPRCDAIIKEETKLGITKKIKLNKVNKKVKHTKKKIHTNRFKINNGYYMRRQIGSNGFIIMEIIVKWGAVY